MPCSLSAILEFDLKDIGSLHDDSIIKVHSYPR